MDNAIILAACKTGDLFSLRSAIELDGRTLSEIAADDIHLLWNQLPCADIDKMLRQRYLESILGYWNIFSLSTPTLLVDL